MPATQEGLTLRKFAGFEENPLLPKVLAADYESEKQRCPESGTSAKKGNTNQSAAEIMLLPYMLGREY